MHKPFRPPTIVGRANPPSQQCPPSSGPPVKRRRVSDAVDKEASAIISAAASIVAAPKSRQLFNPPLRKPLREVPNPGSPLLAQRNLEKPDEGYFTVLWRKFTMKKNKTWDGDGILVWSSGYVSLQDSFGKHLGRIAWQTPPTAGLELSVGGRVVEIEAEISKEDYLAGRTALSSIGNAFSIKNNNKSFRKEAVCRETQGTEDETSLSAGPKSCKVSHTAFKAPLLENTVQIQNKSSSTPVPRHDPTREGALVMKRPTDIPEGKQIVDVVVDPILTSKLREHQRVGVAFLYECVMGMRDHGGEGAILADEMGLGKTLQTIALLWTLLKQNPIHDEPPVLRKALIVCPVTLIGNWRREFQRWLGRERVGVFVARDKGVRLTDFTFGKSYSVMIIGYEKLRMVQEDLQKGAGIDIIIADEGHRLKTAQNKSALAIKSLNTERRIILSGTPVQNDLAEFHTMVNFVNPGLLNKYTVFKREFEVPILKSRQPGAPAKDVEKGEARVAELSSITNKFILRRTAEILLEYLPPKTEYVLLCRPTEAQKTVYRLISRSPAFGTALGSPANSLQLIDILRKVCNSPSLLLKPGDEHSIRAEFLASIPNALLRSPGASGKLQVLDSLLHHIQTTTEEKVVLVSNFTSTMDVLANLLSSLAYKFLRLDGTTPPEHRQEIVDRFNRSPQSNSFVFLLSAKAGGVGLNLVGASRLVLFDLDWNPAVCLQAMARVHRDGQKRPCYIYRLLMQGALDEKMFQRQVSKTSLSDNIVDGKSALSGFTHEELRDLFTLDERLDCQTHRLLRCPCAGRGRAQDDTDQNLPRNDLATLSRNSDIRPSHDKPGTETLYPDSSDEQFAVNRSQLKRANEYSWQAEEADLQRQAKESTDSNGRMRLLSLMQYSHFDTKIVKESAMTAVKGRQEDEVEMPAMDPPENAIEDRVLRDVLCEDEQRIGFVFTKSGS